MSWSRLPSFPRLLLHWSVVLTALAVFLTALLLSPRVSARQPVNRDLSPRTSPLLQYGAPVEPDKRVGVKVAVVETGVTAGHPDSGHRAVSGP